MPANNEGLERLKSGRYRVLIVPGFLSQLYTAFSQHSDEVFDGAVRSAIKVAVPYVGPYLARDMPKLHLPWPKGGLESFATQKDYFTTNRIPFVDISQESSSGFNSQKGVANNAAAIAGVLEKAADKSYILLSHSKGGLDTLEALLEGRKLLREKVSGWVALQAPFHGSLAADLSKLTEPFASILLKAFGGDRESLSDLTIATRSEYMKNNAGRIESLTTGAGSIPIVSGYTVYEANPGLSILKAIENLGTEMLTPALLKSIEDDFSKHFRETFNLVKAALQTAVDLPALINAEINRVINKVLEPFGLMDASNLVLGKLGRNDGLVTTQSAALPGSTMKELLKSDHAGPVMNAAPFRQFWTPQQRIDATEELLAFVAAKAAH